MTARQPFTALCRQLARSHQARADLHIHTTSSDGSYTPDEVVDLAKRSGLAAIAITDHDTLDAVPQAQQSADSSLEVIPGVEITAIHDDSEIHILGYFVRLDYHPLLSALTRICEQRVRRFWEMIDRLAERGVHLRREEIEPITRQSTIGRVHLAHMLVKARYARSVREAFHRYLGDRSQIVVNKQPLPAAEAIRLVHEAGGVAAWAHPNYHCPREKLLQLRELGLQAVEVDHPTFKRGQVRKLRKLAAECSLAVSGGSDCHGPGNFRRAIGARGITVDELEQLRQRASN